jgi:hypothetical protein
MPFGTKMPDELSITGLTRAITANTILVPFSGTIGNTNPRNPFSSLNPKNWILTAVDPPDSVERLAQNVLLVTESNLSQRLKEIPQLLALVEPPAFVVSFDGILTQGAQYQVQLTTSDVDITPAEGCDCADFEAVIIRCDAILTDARDDDGYMRDVANPFLEKDALQFPPSLGTYQFTDTGDLANDFGVSSLRKRVFRRVSAAVGDFFHLPGYGAGVTPRLKRLVRVDEIQRIQSRVRAQVAREPEVRDVAVKVYQVTGDPSTLAVAVTISAAGNPDPLTIVVPVSLP